MTIPSFQQGYKPSLNTQENTAKYMSPTTSHQAASCSGKKTSTSPSSTWNCRMDANGMELIKYIHQTHINTKILVYTMHEELWTIRQLMKEDADAIVMKGDNPQEVLIALRKIEQGKGYFSQQFMRLINSQDTSEITLSNREAEVLEHISNGLSTNDIAQQLNISNNTVEFHRHNLMKKLSANNMAQLVKKAIQLGLNFIK